LIILPQNSQRERTLSKATRKDYLGWPAQELETWLPTLLDNMRFTDVRVKSATRQASAVALEKVTLATGMVELQVDVSINWTEQSDGLTFIVTAEESKFDWTICLCNRTADCVLGAMRTICNIEHGKDT
jgi:hypothetical protein